MRKLTKILGAVFFFIAAPGNAAAVAVPEIDPGLASSAIALLSCGLLILTQQARPKEITAERPGRRLGLG